MSLISLAIGLLSLATSLLSLATRLLPQQQHQVFMLKLLHLQDIWGMWLLVPVVVQGVED
jgi:hypothetical protein